MPTRPPRPDDTRPADDAGDSAGAGRNRRKSPLGGLPGGLFDPEIAAQVKASAQQIWQAGLGAFAKAQAEGSKAFESLVEEGLELQKKSQALAEQKLGEMSGRWSGMASDVQARAEQQWDKLETIFEERTSRALKRLGVPSADDLAALADRIDALSAEVKSLKARLGDERKAGARLAAKKAAKPTAAKKSPRPARKTTSR